jgi:hypothetical protein
MTEILQAVGAIAGIGGIAFGVVLILFREVIRKNIFPQLTKEQAYKLLIVLALLTWSVALAGIGAYILTADDDERAPRPIGSVKIRTEWSYAGGYILLDGRVPSWVYEGVSYYDSPAAKALQAEADPGLPLVHVAESASFSTRIVLSNPPENSSILLEDFYVVLQEYQPIPSPASLGCAIGAIPNLAREEPVVFSDLRIGPGDQGKRIPLVLATDASGFSLGADSFQWFTGNLQLEAAGRYSIQIVLDYVNSFGEKLSASDQVEASWVRASQVGAWLSMGYSRNAHGPSRCGPPTA